MIANNIVLSALLVCCSGLSIGTVSDQKVVDSKTNSEDNFPDWVPFKNKHGDELGTFVPVTKNKVKKRLAPPFNFILRAVAEPESEDYYDKGQGGGDNEDTFESKDWSDLHRPAEPVNNQHVNLTELSDIEGVVNILTRKPANSIIDAINNARNINAEISTEEPDEDENEDKTTETSTNEDETKEDTKEEAKEEKKKKAKSEEEDIDYDEGISDKQKLDPSEDVSDSEARKAKILDAVDELKERHAGESRTLSERVEEEMYKEEFERNRYHPVEVRDKYGNRKKYKKISPDYDEYEDKNISLEDKYRVRPLRPETTTQQSKKYPLTKKLFEQGKLSVFKNPQLYMINDDVEHDETTTVQTLQTPRFLAPLPDTEDERISLIPEDSKAGEPTLFLPKKRKSRRRKAKTTPAIFINTETVTETFKPIPDTTAADTKVDTTSSAISSQVTATSDDVTGTETDVTGTDTDVTGTDNDVTGTDSDTSSNTNLASSIGSTDEDSASTNTDDVTDTAPASSDQKNEDAGGDYHKEKGGGQEHDSEFEETHEEDGKKAYEVTRSESLRADWMPTERKVTPWYLGQHYVDGDGHHEDTKTTKGFHDKDNHLGKYEDHGGVDKQHNEETDHYGNHHHEEHGKKHAQYEESGKHTKGHSTKGSHDVHKKDEYEKKVEFFEEDGDSAEEEKHGGFDHERGHAEGGKYKKDNLKMDHQYHTKGESGYFGKGDHSRVNKGHRQAAGHDKHAKHGARHFHKEGSDGGMKWIYHHGSPAQTANLVVIDRRGDQWFHGPRYYG